MSDSTTSLLPQHAWLVDALARHLAMYVASYRTMPGVESQFQFEGLNETAAVVLLSKIFEGLGFGTLYEQRVYERGSQRLDLWAEELTSPKRWLIEAKVIVDGDQRLNRKRFTETREILEDLSRLALWNREPANKAAIWIAFSASSELSSAGSHDGSFSLQAAVDAVPAYVPQASLGSSRTVTLGDYGPCDPKARVAHIFYWRVG